MPFGYCEMCQYNILNSTSGTIGGKELHGAYYCWTCYPKAVDVFLAEQRLNTKS